MNERGGLPFVGSHGLGFRDETCAVHPLIIVDAGSRVMLFAYVSSSIRAPRAFC